MGRFCRILLWGLWLAVAAAQAAEAPPLNGAQIAAGVERIRQLRQQRPDLLQPQQGVLVRFLMSDGQGAAVGVRPGDILASYAGIAISEPEQLILLVGQHAADGRAIPLSLVRDEQLVQLSVKPGRLGIFMDVTKPHAPLPSTPLLRLDTGNHLQHFKLDSDRAGRWLATASHDKTIRVWDPGSGKLLQVLRPPQDAGNEGELSAVALSPDGEWLAAAGASTGGSYLPCIYLFRRSTGELVRKIDDLPDTVVALAWSADGRFLAAGTGAAGLNVYRAADFAMVAEDRHYGGSIWGMDFSADGRLVTVASDGEVRLYRPSAEGYALAVRRAVAGGKQLSSVRFSPDGRRVAVGMDDRAVVAVHDASSLEPLYTPNTYGMTSGAMTVVAWGSDGSLYGGGTVAGGVGAMAPRVVRQWRDGGQGSFQDVPVGTNRLTSLKALPDGAIAFATADPQWGVLDRDGRRLQLQASTQVDMRPGYNELYLSSDGATVQFKLEKDSPTLYRFGVAERGMNAGGERLNAATTAVPGAQVSAWLTGSEATLNGKILVPAQFGRTLSVALAPGAGNFVLGTDFYLFFFSSTGNKLWSQRAPGAVWRLNVSADGRLLAGSFSDGTIRWYRLSDGQELLALFPHADKQRWVLWTPSGYFDAAPGAEELIGWHLNRGADRAADFFPASRFRERFYRPDVVARVLAARDEGEALRLANAERGGRSEAARSEIAALLPPVLELAAPADQLRSSGPSVVLRYRVRSPGDAPVTGLRARVNGQAVSLRGAPAAGADEGATREVTVPIPAQDSEIQLFAENRNGVSTPVTARVSWTGAKPATQEAATFKPKLYVLAVGVSRYANPAFNLGLAAKDAGDFANVLREQKGRLYADVQVRLLTDAKATREEVVDGLDWLKSQVTSRDIAIVFLAGHGVNDNTGKYYFVPHNGDPERLLRTAVPQTDIRDTLNSLAGKAVFFVDTCHAGNVLGTARTRALGTDVNAFVNELASAENGVVVFSAATGRQYSLEDPAWGNGAFTKAVVEGLRGKADFGKNGKITHKGLDYYVTERVKELTKGQQSPVSITPSGITDFPIAVSKP